MNDYAPRAWPPGQQPMLPGSPSSPPHGPARRAAYLAVGVLVALTGGLGNALVTVNLPYLQGALGAYAAEIQWLPAAYAMTMVSMNLLLVKFRQQFGLQLFTELVLGVYAAVALLHLLVHTLAAAVAVRAAAGAAGAALTVLGLYYVMQGCTPAWRRQGLVVGIGLPQLAMPLARTFSERLLAVDEWRGLVLFESGLALLALGCVLLLKLPAGDRLRAFEREDFLTFGLFAPGMALLCAVLALGRSLWWFDTAWLGWCLAAAILLVAAALILEHRRARPLLDVRWLSSGQIARLFLAALLIRVVLAEANGAVGFLQSFGLTNDQMATLWLAVAVASVCGLGASALLLTPARVPWLLMAALACIASGAFMDAFSTNLVRPAQMLGSQLLIGFGATLFFGPVFAGGLGAVLAQPGRLVSFSVTFTITQTIGSLLGSALVGTLQVVREKYHSSQLVEHLAMTNPLVAARLQDGAATFAGATTDPALRTAQGLSLLGASATREANVLAYNDVFMTIAVLAVLTLLWLLVGQCHARFLAARGAAR